MNKTLSNSVVSILTFVFVFLSGCKKDDDSFTPIQVVDVEEKLVGRWEVNEVKAIGVLTVAGVDVQTNADSDGQPEGYYELAKDPNEYTYDLQSTLIIEALGGTIKQELEYDDRDAGTWEVAANEKSVLFKGNQGINQDVFFTHSDTNGVFYLELAIPVDTTIRGYPYDGTVFVNMTKVN